MDDSNDSPQEGVPHKRRTRYRGKNPRRFEDKYKEHDPKRYADDVAKVLAAGKTPAGTHRPILVEEIVEALALGPGALVVDCTLGFGGHTEALLARVQPGGQVLGLDVDPLELPKTTARLRALGWDESAFRPVQANFADLIEVLEGCGLSRADAILADLGVSSMQIDNPARGFTFKVDCELDLRLDPSRGRSAAEWLAEATPAELEAALVENADEPYAAAIAREVSTRRWKAPFLRTGALANAIREALDAHKPPRDTEDHDRSVRRVFQALRIAVNDEFAVLDRFLAALPQCLKPGGRVAVLSFHSGEDRRVKRAFKEGVREGIYASTNRELVRAGAEERRANPRSTSAKLRWAIRADAG